MNVNSHPLCQEKYNICMIIALVNENVYLFVFKIKVLITIS